MNIKKHVRVLSLACCAAVATAAQATVLTFDGYNNSIFGDENTSTLSVVSFGGYNFTSNGDHFHFITTPVNGFTGNGTSALLEDRDYAITMTAGTGAAFDLYSIYYAGSSGSSLSVKGLRSDGSSVTASLVASTTLLSAQLSGFKNITSVIFDGVGGSGNFLLDNISVGAASAASAVPLPGTLPLLGAGLAALAMASRRRKAR